MKKAVWSGLAAAAIVLGISATAAAQPPVTVTVNANLTAKAKLTLSGGPVSFPDQDPDAASVLTAISPLTVEIKVRNSALGSVTLNVQAGGNLLSPDGDTIPIGNLSWESADAGFTNGTASVSDTSAGSWSGPGSRSGSQTFKLVNDWSYKSGNYTVTLTYTLTAA